MDPALSVTLGGVVVSAVALVIGQSMGNRNSFANEAKTLNDMLRDDNEAKDAVIDRLRSQQDILTNMVENYRNRLAECEQSKKEGPSA